MRGRMKKMIPRNYALYLDGVFLFMRTTSECPEEPMVLDCTEADKSILLDALRFLKEESDTYRKAYRDVYLRSVPRL
jgi:hypothetical protein